MNKFELWEQSYGNDVIDEENNNNTLTPHPCSIVEKDRDIVVVVVALELFKSALRQAGIWFYFSKVLLLVNFWKVESDFGMLSVLNNVEWKLNLSWKFRGEMIII